jgi:hypothetical protein
MLVFPRTDLFSLCNVASIQPFWPKYRQEVSRTANGWSQGKDLGPPLWQGSFTTAPQTHVDSGALEAALLSLGGVLRSFEAYDTRRPYPAAHADGNFDDTAVILEIGADNKSLSLSGLVAGFQISPGDYLSFDYGVPQARALHRALSPATVGAGGETGSFEVFPHIEPGALVAAPVTLKRASCLMVLDPDQPAPTVQDLLFSTQTFSGVQIL